MGIFGKKKSEMEKAIVAEDIAPAEEQVNQDVNAFGAEDPLTMVPRVEPPNPYFVNVKQTISKTMKPGEKATVRWEYAKGFTKEEIEDIIPNCRCTANVTWGNAGVQAVFRHEEQKVAKNGELFTKNMTVYMDDGVRKIPDGRGAMMWPPHKKLVVLSFTVTLLP